MAIDDGKDKGGNNTPSNVNEIKGPANGVVLIDDRTATSVSYQRSGEASDDRFEVTFKLGNKIVQRESGLSGEQLDLAVGKDNAAQIRKDENSKGVLRGEELAYAYGLSPNEAAGRAARNSDQDVEALTAEVRERAAAQRARDKAARDLPFEPNEISNNSPRHRLRDSVDEAIQRENQELRHLSDVDKAAKPKEALDVDPNDLALQLGTALRKRYLEAGENFHFRGNNNEVAFSHTDKDIVTKHNSADVARDMVALSVAKGWTEIHLKGTEEFKREAWLEASTYGVKVEGYKPRDVDLARLKEIQDEAARKDALLSEKTRSTAISSEIKPQDARTQTTTQSYENSANVVPIDRNKNRSEGEGADAKPNNKSEPAVLGELQHLMRSRGDSEAAIAMATLVAAERFERHHSVVVGTLKSHGAANYQNDPTEKPSYYVTVETRSGEKTVWGVDLSRAVLDSGAKNGELIALESKGKVPVSVEEKVRDEGGQVIGSRTIDAHRNRWDVTSLDAARAAIKDEFSELAQRHGLKPNLPDGYRRDTDLTNDRDPKDRITLERD